MMHGKKTQKPTISYKTVKLEKLNRTENIVINGNGKIPAFCIGTGSITAKFIPDKLKCGEYGVTIYCIDFDFVVNSNTKISKKKIAKKNLNVLLNEIEETRKALGLGKIALLTHSSYFGIGLEYIKKYPQKVLFMKSDGAPLSPLNFEETGPAHKFFEKEAKLKVKNEHKNRLKRYKKYIKKKGEISGDEITPDSTSIYEWTLSSIAKGAYFSNMGKKIAEMWKKGVSGKIANEVMREHYFWKIFNKEIATKDNIINSLNKIKVPIQFIYGEKDYFLNMSLIKELSQKKKLSNKHEFVFLPEAGHYPMFEQQKQYIKISNAFMKKYHLGTKFSFLNQSKQGKILSKIKPHDQDTPSNVLNNGK